MVRICQVILQDHVNNGSCDFMGGSPLSYHTAKFGEQALCGGSGDKTFLICHVILQHHMT